jgi:coenzyme Q-binding protein COQ10
VSSLIRVERIVPHRADDLFDLVGNVRRYPDFIPWIKAMRVTDLKLTGGVESFLAEAVVGFKMVRERFATRVSRNARAKTIDVEFHSGPFRRLENHWAFVERPGGALVTFDLDFEFKGPMLQLLVNANRERAAAAIMEAFLKEADRRYQRIV